MQDALQAKLHELNLGIGFLRKRSPEIFTCFWDAGWPAGRWCSAEKSFFRCNGLNERMDEQ